MRVIYGGHELDIYISLDGYVAYMDGDLEPHTISEQEYVEYATHGKFVSLFRK